MPDNPQAPKFPDDQDYSRALGYLNQSGTNQKNNPLYQTVKTVIRGLQNWQAFSQQQFSDSPGSTGGSTSDIIGTITDIINNLNTAGYVKGPASAVDGQGAVFDGTTGKLIKALTDSGILKAISGVISSTALTADTNDYLSGDGTFQPLILRRATLVLTDAQIRALPITLYDFIPAPPINYRNKIFGVSIAVTLQAAYVNVDATYADFHGLDSGGQYIIYGPTNDNTMTPVLTQITDLLTASKYTPPIGTMYDIPMPFMAATGAVPVATTAFYVLNEEVLSRDVQDHSKIRFGMDNNGSGVLTGGNAGNSMRVTAYYAIEEVV